MQKDGERKLKLTDEAWSYGSYPRGEYKKDTIYTFYQYKDFLAVYAMGRFLAHDSLVCELLSEGIVTPEEEKEYNSRLLDFVKDYEKYDPWPIERIYGEVHRLRREVLGADALEAGRLHRFRRPCDFDLRGGIDQTRMKQEWFACGKAVIMALCQDELFSLMVRDAKEALSQGSRLVMLVSESAGEILPSEKCLREQLGQHGIRDGQISFLVDSGRYPGLDLSGAAWEESLQQLVERNEAALFVYGEEGLLHCRNLRIDAVVQAVPTGYCARALVGQPEGGRPCVVYVPKHYDMVSRVGLTKRTEISYRQLYLLWKAYGGGIYRMSAEELYRQYPQYFLNIYGNETKGGEAFCPEAETGYPIQIRWPEETGENGGNVIKQYGILRDQAVSSFLDGQPEFTYVSAYFDEKLERADIPWGSTVQQPGILVHGIRTGRAERSRILRLDGSRPLRQQLREKAIPQNREDGTAAVQIFSNFLFFLTPKLAGLYNELRKDRPREQIAVTGGHLDYMLCRESGKRMETFPLYRKACIAMKADGSFLMFHYRLGGGVISVSGCEIRWEAEDVDRIDPKASHRPVQVYTPYMSGTDEAEACKTEEYRCLVGEGRLNLVIVQERIVCVRRGDVVLPSIGVVISLDASRGQEFLQKTGCGLRENGYYDCDGLELTVELDGPAGIPEEQWRQVRWAYGGGLSLIVDGCHVYGAEESENTDAGSDGGRKHQTDWIREEGWLSPLSRQTQETEIHRLAKHPRTAIGMTENGDLFVLVFSGRTLLSTGADYREMCRIAGKLFPDVRYMMNADGGGSSVLGLAVNGYFMELSYPATSFGSCAGMVRPVNTVLCLE